MSAPPSKHRLAEERSLAYHRAVAEEIERNPELLEKARARAKAWAAEEGRSSPYAREWMKILELPLPAIRAFLVDPGERATTLRQSTPFAGAIPPRERWRIWREVRDAFEKRMEPSKET